jgi:hypothetical protein
MNVLSFETLELKVAFHITVYKICKVNGIFVKDNSVSGTAVNVMKYVDQQFTMIFVTATLTEAVCWTIIS